MKRPGMIVVGVLFVCGLAPTTHASPRVDPVLQSRLTTAQATDLFGLILTFNGDTPRQRHLLLSGHGRGDAAN